MTTNVMLGGFGPKSILVIQISNLPDKTVTETVAGVIPPYTFQTFMVYNGCSFRFVELDDAPTEENTKASTSSTSSTTTDSTAAASITASQVGEASGVASLDASGVIPQKQIPFGTKTGTVADGGVVAKLQSTLDDLQKKVGPTTSSAAATEPAPNPPVPSTDTSSTPSSQTIEYIPQPDSPSTGTLPASTEQTQTPVPNTDLAPATEAPAPNATASTNHPHGTPNFA